MSTTVVIPDFQYTSHFYAEVLEDLTQYMRVNCPELTDEDPTEPHMQLMRAFSLSYHLNSTLLDLVANEMFLPTAKLRTSHVALLALIDVQLRQASPASTTLVTQMSQVFTTARTIAPAGSLFATIETKAAQSVEFEVLEEVEVTLRTDEVGYVYAKTSAGSFTDHTAEARTDTGNFTPTWGGATAGDELYIGHPDVQFDQLDFLIDTAGVGITGVWEYYDGNFDQGQPSSVVNNGSDLTIHLNSILGTASRAGTTVRVRSAVTGAYQDLTSTFSGGSNQVLTLGPDPFLSQTSPSTTASDYIVGTDWREMSDIVDASSGLSVLGATVMTYTLPQTLEQAWSRTEVGVGVLAVEAYWLRFRIISVSTPTTPIITQIVISEGSQYMAFPVTQGHSRSDSPLGSSDGTDSQVFTFTQYPVIDDDNIVVTVTEASVDQVYNRVDNFLNSLPTDRHYTLVFDDDGAAVITFGDGTNGKIPTVGVNNIRATYRTMDDIDGNVGANTVTVNRSGVAFMSNVFNPRAAAGYTIREGSTDEDLARLKVAGPAQLRVRRRAVSTEDTEVMATLFVASDGSYPVARALAIEEAFGPKTVELVVVGAGGNQVDADKLEDIADFYNGNDDDEEGVLVLNHELTPTNFTENEVDITMTLTDGNAVSVVTALTALLNPLAKKSDGTYAWQFGGDVQIARLIQVIMDTSPPPTNVSISLPAADISLGVRELPVKGTITINGLSY